MAINSEADRTIGWDSRYEEVLRPHLPFAEPDRPLQGADDLRELGLDSMETIQLLLDLESSYGLTFPDELLTAETFTSVGGLWEAVSQLIGASEEEG
jgi:acyl carrier protein